MLVSRTFKLVKGRGWVMAYLIHVGKSIGLVILTVMPLSCAILTYCRILSFANLGINHLAPTKDEKDALAIGEMAGVKIGFSSSSSSGAS